MFVAQPTVEDTISILRGLKDKYEVSERVRQCLTESVSELGQ